MNALEIMGICFIVEIAIIITLILSGLVLNVSATFRNAKSFSDLEKLIKTGKINITHTKNGEEKGTEVKDLHKYADNLNTSSTYEELKNNINSQKKLDKDNNFGIRF